MEKKIYSGFCVYRNLYWVVLLSSLCVGKIVYVDAMASGANDGSSWKDAYMRLQDALVDVGTSNEPSEIRIASGQYKPCQESGGESKDQVGTFTLNGNIIIRGGYRGCSGPDGDHRDVRLYETILSGDCKGDDLVLQRWEVFNNYSKWYLASLDNCYPVVTVAAGAVAVIDGVTIADGHNYLQELGLRESYPIGRGGGLVAAGSEVTVISCIFRHNFAGYGSAMYCEGAKVSLQNCQFVDNYLYNGTVYLKDCDASLNGCRFAGNFSLVGWTLAKGLGLVCDRSNVIASGCTFSGNGNQFGSFGGAIHNVNGSELVVIGCIFTGNRANYASGLFNSDSTASILNCTFHDRGTLLASWSEHRPSVVNISNSIIWAADQAKWWLIENRVGSIMKVQYCNIQGGEGQVRDLDPNGSIVWGPDNIELDPLFAHPGCWDPRDTPNNPDDDAWVDGDYHLKSQAGRWDPASQTWVKDDVTSPCIDAGDPTIPVVEEPFPNGGRINMGAYGGTQEASKSYFGEPVCETIVAGDIDGNCKVDLHDLAILASHWLEGW